MGPWPVILKPAVKEILAHGPGAHATYHTTPQRITLVESPTGTPQGVTMDMDSYQPTTEVRLPTRKRRPWWRWNLITLAVVLFCLLWTRELLKFDPSSAWLMAGTIFFFWAIIPVPWGDWSFTTMPDYAKESPRKRVAKRKTITTFCRLLAFCLVIAAVGNTMASMYFYVAAAASFRTMSAEMQMIAHQLVTIFVQLLFHMTVAAILWLLAESLEKLDHVTNELRTQEERTGSGK